MGQVKLAVVYYSSYGTNFAMAGIAAEAGAQAGAEVRLLRVAETVPAEVVATQDAWKSAADAQSNVAMVTAADMEWANAYLLLTPTRFGQASSQMRAFIDTLGGLWFQGKLAGKPVSAMTSAQNAHAGQEATILGLYTTFCHWGSVIVPPGFTSEAISATGGNPYGYSHTQGKPFDEAARASIAHQVERLTQVAAKLA